MTTQNPGPTTVVEDINRYSDDSRRWTAEAIKAVQADAQRSADTHMIRVPLPEEWGIDLYLKDESSHPTGSLKHRLARSLFLHALCNGWIRPNRPVVEASSGSTAVSEAYFSRLIGVPFIAVMSKTTSARKVELIESYGGQCHFVDSPDQVYTVAADLARETDGHYMDQFTYAERATDWRGNNNIAESIFNQLRLEPHPEPAWIVATAGTGGHLGHTGQVRPIHGPNHGHLRGRPGQLGVLRRLAGRKSGCHHGQRIPHRGDRTPAHGGQFHAGEYRPHDAHPRRRERGGDRSARTPDRAKGGRLHGHRTLRRLEDRLRHARGGGSGQRCGTHLR
jgi:hypothetical protein